MKYSRQEFFRLMEAIEEDGGEHLDKVHEHSNFTAFSGGPVQDVQLGYIKNCGESALFSVPYISFLNNNDLRELEVCAKDDMMGLWPRFASANATGETA